MNAVSTTGITLSTIVAPSFITLTAIVPSPRSFCAAVNSGETILPGSKRNVLFPGNLASAEYGKRNSGEEVISTRASSIAASPRFLT